MSSSAAAAQELGMGWGGFPLERGRSGEFGARGGRRRGRRKRRERERVMKKGGGESGITRARSPPPAPTTERYRPNGIPWLDN